MNTSRKTLAAEVADSIRQIVATGQVEAGCYLPPERELVKRFGVSRVTVRRALGKLVDEGLLETVPHQGYRPVMLRNEAGQPGSVAYVLAVAGPEQTWDFTHEQIVTAFNRKLMAEGRQALAVGAKGRPAAGVFQELKEQGIWGLVLDSSIPEYIDAAIKSKLPCVMVDAFTDRGDMDIVLQDNFGGARRATEYLLGQGHQRIAWVGPSRGLSHYRERFAGARAALNDIGRDFVPELMIQAPANEADEGTLGRLRKLLRGKQRPSGLVCMWRQWAVAAAGAIREAGLEVGKDVEIVAWATEREYREVLAGEFLGDNVPATVVWSPDEMAELAIERLQKRASQPNAPTCRTDVRVRLIEPQKAEDVLRRSARSAASRA
jgi:GntR family transcriptional regulator, arabinose operon transcriptional repressor